MARPVSFIFRDAKGNVAKTKLYLTTTAAAFETEASLFATNMQAISNGFVTTSIDNAAPVAYGATGLYQNVEDKIQLVFQKHTSGGTVRFQIPAPKETTAGGALFLSDDETADPSNPELATLIAQMSTAHASCAARDGQTLDFVGGVRVRRKTHRKLNIFVLTPSLTPDVPGE